MKIKRYQTVVRATNVPYDEISFVSVPLSSIPTDRELRFAFSLLIAGNYVLFKNVGDILSAARAEELSSKIDTVYIHRVHWDLYLGDLVKTLPSKELWQESPFRAASSLRLVVLGYLREMEEKKKVTATMIETFREAGLSFGEALVERPDLIDQLTKHYQAAWLYPVNHTINVAAISCLMAKKIGMQKSEIQSLSTAILLHNVGNVFLPKGLLYKDGELSSAESETLRTHTEKGSAQLRVLGSSEETVLTALQHHEKIDGSGYPEGLQDKEIHPFAKICRIADVYDALVSIRPHESDPLSSRHALEYMKSLSGSFDPDFLSTLASYAPNK